MKYRYLFIFAILGAVGYFAYKFFIDSGKQWECYEDYGPSSECEESNSGSPL